MLVSHVFVVAIPLFFGCIHFLEYSAIMARLGGIEANSHMLGYSIQQAVYVGTRLFIVCLLPMLGFVVDSQISQLDFKVMATAALLGAAALSLLAYSMQNMLIAYYRGVIGRYKKGGGFARAFLGGADRSRISVAPFSQVRNALSNPEGRSIALHTTLVFAIYSTGIFIAFYAALANFEYRASISQLSGIINSIGTVLLTFFVEPRISRRIDGQGENAEILIHALLIGRFFGVAIVGQMLLLAAYVVI